MAFFRWYSHASQEARPPYTLLSSQRDVVKLSFAPSLVPIVDKHIRMKLMSKIFLRNIE